MFIAQLGQRTMYTGHGLTRRALEDELALVCIKVGFHSEF